MKNHDYAGAFQHIHSKAPQEIARMERIHLSHIGINVQTPQHPCSIRPGIKEIEYVPG